MLQISGDSTDGNKEESIAGLEVIMSAICLFSSASLILGFIFDPEVGRDMFL
jgi:hypothetical protein